MSEHYSLWSLDQSHVCNTPAVLPLCTMLRDDVQYYCCITAGAVRYGRPSSSDKWHHTRGLPQVSCARYVAVGRQHLFNLSSRYLAVVWAAARYLGLLQTLACEVLLGVDLPENCWFLHQTFGDQVYRSGA